MIIAAVIQARMGSSRLPGKVLRRVGRRSMLALVIEHARKIPGVSVVMVATTTNPRDDAIVHACRGAGARWCRGSERDVLARYVLAAELAEATVIVRLTADCPLLDPAVAGEVLQAYLAAGPDCVYASNVHPPSWPDGCDIEVFSRDALLRAAREATPDQREHVTTSLWQRYAPAVGQPPTLPGERRPYTINVALPAGQDYSALKLSVDRAEDLDRVRNVFAALPDQDRFGWRDVLEAHAQAYPTPIERRARRIFGSSPRVADRRVAYLAGVEAAVTSSPARCPYSTGAEPLRVAWMLGWEDVADLGRRPMVCGSSG